ncbi:AraC family transcriptional regulator [Cellvibrio sp. pealriver]|uniref:helix-turn-helix domain-containing protein n=1 Tax=Cellvibrio sp. pealriver TaxID=1622269 RepID=UPI00066FF3CB|nr:helix-turn-helix domain-containing protein [Cellvibrio sp. pealriver]
MDKLVLSFNDVPLILVIFQSLLFSVLLLTVNLGKRQANFFLAIFLLAIGLDAFDTLIYWSPSIKVAYLDGAVHIFYWLKFSVYLAAPMLFFYVKSMIDPDFKPRWRDAVHLLPLLAFPLFIVALYTGLTAEERVLGITQFGLLFNEPAFQLHLWARHLLYVGYGIACFYLLFQYKNRLKQHYSNIENIDLFWLQMLIGGFLMIWVWVFIAYLLTLINSSQWLGNLIGISGNVFSFVFVNALVLYSMAHANIGYRQVLPEVEEKSDTPEPEKYDPLIMTRLNQLMKDKELYLDPEFTLEQLAEISEIPVRKISAAINRDAGQNFFDYINLYRVQKAASILANRNNKMSMLDVMADAGFNSKSTFYRAFKKFMNMTPTDYVDQINRKS